MFLSALARRVHVDVRLRRYQLPAATTNPVPQPDSAMLTVSPSSVSVAAVVGNTGSQTVTATNVGNSSVAIKQVTVTGAGFSTTGLAVPASVAPGASQSFQVAFAATIPGTATAACPS